MNDLKNAMEIQYIMCFLLEPINFINVNSKMLQTSNHGNIAIDCQ